MIITNLTIPNLFSEYTSPILVALMYSSPYFTSTRREYVHKCNTYINDESKYANNSKQGAHPNMGRVKLSK